MADCLAMQRTVFEDTLINCVKEAASTGPALVNAAMLMAQGCPKRYAEVLSALYTANHLQCPDLSLLFDQQVTEIPEFEYHSAVPDETEEFDDVESFLRDVEDVDELPASFNEVQDILTNFDTLEEFTCQSITDDSLLKIDDQRMSFNSNYYTISPSSNAHVSPSNHDLDDWFDENLSIHSLSLPIADDGIKFGESPFASTAPAFSILNSPILSPIDTNIVTCNTPTKSKHQVKWIAPVILEHRMLNHSDYSPLLRASSSPIKSTKYSSTLSIANSTPVSVSKSSNISRAKSASTCFLATSTPVGVIKSSITRRAKSSSTSFLATPVGVIKSSIISRAKPTSTLPLATTRPASVSRSSNITTTKSSCTCSLATLTPVGVSKSSNISRINSTSTWSPATATQITAGNTSNISRSKRHVTVTTGEGESFVNISLSEISTPLQKLACSKFEKCIQLMNYIA